ncbi:MAG: HAD hydrolase-like protein [Acidobacteria bacterium]|nr:HAD hydrolase-like protein [Acidobacteriota bacterium]
MTRIRAALLDIDGTLTDGVAGPALPGAVDAVRRLREQAFVRCVTNTTSRPRAFLAAALRREGFDFEEREIVTPTALARTVLEARGEAEGVLVADGEPPEDLAWYRATEPGRARSVLVAGECHDRTVRELFPALDALLAGARLYTLQQNRVFRRAGRLVTDLGPVAALLGYAANVGWENLGKPSPLLFRTLADELGCAVDELAMVGDDAEFDVAGAIEAGVGVGVLVRTGKYRPRDEDRAHLRPHAVIASIADLVLPTV